MTGEPWRIRRLAGGDANHSVTMTPGAWPKGSFSWLSAGPLLSPATPDQTFGSRLVLAGCGRAASRERPERSAATSYCLSQSVDLPMMIDNRSGPTSQRKKLMSGLSEHAERKEY